MPVLISTCSWGCETVLYIVPGRLDQDETGRGDSKKIGDMNERWMTIRHKLYKPSKERPVEFPPEPQSQPQNRIPCGRDWPILTRDPTTTGLESLRK
jgi:hypothetical protein